MKLCKTKLVFMFILSNVAIGCTFVEDRSAEPVSIVDAKAQTEKPVIPTNTTKAITKNQVYRVQKGDTLGSIAYKFLGSTSFYTKIAALNNINPSQPIHLGQKLIIPTDKPIKVAVDNNKMDIESQQLQTVDESIELLITQSEFRKAINLLLKKAKSNNSKQVQDQLKSTVNLHISDLSQKNNDGEIERSLNALISNSSVSAENKIYFSKILNQKISNQYIAQAKASNEQGNDENIFSNLRKAFELSPETAQTNPDFTQLRNQITERKQQSALRLYRSQKLEQALTVWQEILIIKPNDDLALVYIDRVKAIQQKLKEL